jgi:hypothetical protein
MFQNKTPSLPAETAQAGPKTTTTSPPARNSSKTGPRRP